MAEFCFNCFKEKLEPTATAENTTLSTDLDFCEGCGEMKNVVTEFHDCK